MINPIKLIIYATRLNRHSVITHEIPPVCAENPMRAYWVEYGISVHANVHSIADPIRNRSSAMCEILPLAWHLGVKMKMSTNVVKSAKSRMYIK